MKKVLAAIVMILLGFSMTTWAEEAFQVKEGLNGVKYVSDGVGEVRREAFETLLTDFNLQLVFANKAGDYVADVKVDVVDLSNYDEVVHDVSVGPLFYANLPIGNYHVVVNYKGEQITKKLIVKAGQARHNIYYHFKDMM